MTPQPKRHHFIPEFVLQNFAGDNGRLWFHRPDFGLEIRPTAPKNLFVEGNLNTIFEENGERDLRIEELFGKLEGMAGEIFPPMLDAARIGRPIKMSDNAWDVWDNYMYYQMKRPPSAIRRAEREISLDDVLKQTIAEEEAAGRIDSVAKADLLTEASIELIRHNARASARIRRPEPELWKLIQSCGLNLLVIPNRSLGEFIVGDVGMVPPSSVLARFFTAIAPDVAFVQTYRSRTVHIRNVRDRSLVRRLNIETARASEMIAGRDPGAIRFIAGRRPRLEVTPHA